MEPEKRSNTLLFLVGVVAVSVGVWAFFFSKGEVMAYFWENPMLQINPPDPGEDRSPHYPFKSRAHLGPGPLAGTNQRAQNWDCMCDNYKCVCYGISDETEGRIKTIYTNAERKKAYNKMYRQWRKGR